MTYIIINEANQYRLAKLLESTKNYYQITVLPDQINKKIKPTQKIYDLIINNPEEFLLNLTNAAAAIDIQLLWEMLDDCETKLSIYTLSQIYFGDNPTNLDQTSLLIALSEQYVNFIDYGNGYFKKCTKEEQSKRQAILYEKQLQQQLFDSYYQAFTNFTAPPPLEHKTIVRLLNKPDKNSTIYKALFKASKELGLSGLEIFCKIGLITNLEQFFIDSFMFETLPDGINHTYNNQQSLTLNIEINDTVQIFSIDDASTTEIDDAFSVTYLANTIIIGIHIAAPALDQNLKNMAAHNISTIYYPGEKITMFPHEIIDKYSLTEGRTLPVVSIYFKLDQDLQILEYYSRLETVTIKQNLRIEELEALFSPDNNNQREYPFKQELMTLYKFACTLEQKRGKPSVSAIAKDFNFLFAGEKIIIKPRLRGNPIDKLVSELMILANCSWGRTLTNAFIPAIYRVKQPNFPVKMTNTADSHTGLNVNYYTWATSPLRRSVDYINQTQIISLITHPQNRYTALDYTFLEVVNNFDKKYAKYLDFQTKMERFWALKFLLQEQLFEVNATFIFKTKVQLDNIPLELDVNGMTTMKPKGTQIKIKIFNINLTKLSFEFKIMSEVNLSCGDLK